MSKYYITNGNQYLDVSSDSVVTLGTVVTRAKRFKYDHAINTLPLIQGYGKGNWCIQKYYSSASGKNYVITNASKFVGSNDLVVDKVEKARAFKYAADAESYIRSHGNLIVSLGADPIIVNEEFETVDSLGRKRFTRQNLMNINLKRKSEVKKVKRQQLDKGNRLAVYERDNGICQICGKPLSVDDFTVDHIVPLNRGGINDLSNYRCTCRRCNEWKKDSLDEELVTMLKDVGSYYMYKHHESDLMDQFVRSWWRGIIYNMEDSNNGN